MLDLDTFARLRSLGVSEDLAEGVDLFRAGDSNPDLFVVESGRVDIIREATAGSRAQVVAQWQSGEFLGELSMLTGQSSLLTARMVEAGRGLPLPNATFRQVMSTDGPLSDLLLGTFRARRRLLMAAAEKPSRSSATRLRLRRWRCAPTRGEWRCPTTGSTSTTDAGGCRSWHRGAPRPSFRSC